MPELIKQHEAFAQALSGGATQENAYRLAGYKPSRQHAHRLATKATIQARVAEIKGDVVDKLFGNKLEDIIAQIEEDRIFARKQGQPAVALNATMSKAKLLGHVIDKAETKTANFNYNTMTEQELNYELTAVLQEVRKLGAKTR